MRDQTREDEVRNHTNLRVKVWFEFNSPSSIFSSLFNLPSTLKHWCGSGKAPRVVIILKEAHGVSTTLDRWGAHFFIMDLFHYGFFIPVLDLGSI